MILLIIQAALCLAALAMGGYIAAGIFAVLFLWTALKMLLTKLTKKKA